MSKKNNLVIVLVLIIILSIIAIISLKVRSQKPETEIQPVSQADKDLNSAMTSDKTTDINNGLNNINLDNTSTTDLQSVDNELKKL